MTSGLGSQVLNTSNHSVSATDNVTTQNALSVLSHFQTVTQNASYPDGCIEVAFNEMDYLPWDNPDNIVTEEVEHIVRRIKDNALVLLFLIGGPANVINMVVFYKQGLKDRVNLCLFALSLADELYLIAAMSNHAEQVHLQFTSNDRFGPVMTFVANNHLIGFLGFSYVSPVMSAIIATERCLCVLSPLKFQTLLRTRTMAVMIIVVYALVVGLYFIVALRFYIGCTYDPVSGAVVEMPIMSEFYRTLQAIIDRLDSFVFGAGLPGVVMIVVITATIITVVKLRQILTWRAGTSSSISPREVALTKMLVGNSILFIVCIFPFALARISWLFLPEMNLGRRNHNFFLTTVWLNEILLYINASFNIFVYYCMGSRYRNTCCEIFTRKQKSEKNVRSTISVSITNE